MSSQKLKSFARFLAIGSAALLLHVGSAAAANQRPDIQEQMQEVLSGNVAAHAGPRTQSRQPQASASAADSQAFVKRLLQGWSVSASAATRPAPQPSATASELSKGQDIQAMVRRQLLGV